MKLKEKVKKIRKKKEKHLNKLMWVDKKKKRRSQYTKYSVCAN